MQKDSIKVFIGSGEASLLERKVAIYSLHKSSTQPLDIFVFNGTHNAVEQNEQAPVLAPMPLNIKYKNSTEFSLYRYLIPQLCGYKGKAIYIDSDVLCLSDIGELFNLPLAGHDFLAKSDAYSVHSEGLWGLSVMLIDCEKCRFDLARICHEVDQHLYSMNDFSCMSPRFLNHHSYSIGELDSSWNSFDYWDKTTNLIHYTNLHRQPWKYPDHPYGELWFEYFDQAFKSGMISERDIQLSIDRAYVRPSILEGNSTKLQDSLRYAASSVKRSVISLLRAPS